MGERLYYLSDFADEIMPCAATLDGWAQWLAAPDPDWSRPDAAAEGEEFDAFTLEVLAEVECVFSDGRWLARSPLPADTETVYPRWDGPDTGWSASAAKDLSGPFPSADPVDEALKESWAGVDDGETAWVACVRSGPSLRLRFDRDGGAPVLRVLCEVGRA
jgi:hypothetical protein